MADEIRIKSVKVVRLFGRLTYNIDFENQSNVSILIGPNGCGKTTIFNFLNFLLNPQAETLLPIIHIPFESFTCCLSNGKTIVLTRGKTAVLTRRNEMGKDMLEHKHIILEDDRERGQLKLFPFWEWDFKIKISSGKSKEGKDFDLLSASNECEKKPGWLRARAEEIEDNLGAIAFFSEYLDFEGNDQSVSYLYAKCIYVCERYQNFLRENKCLTSVSFISANRLNPLNALSKISTRFLRYRFGFFSMPTEKEQYDVLLKACRDAAFLIKGALEKYNQKLTEAKNKLPSMYLRSSENKVTFDTFKARWKKYHSELDKYHAIGLLPKADIVIKEAELKTAFNKKKQFLIEYLNAFEGTLEPLEKIYIKIKLFSDIFEKRNEITHKSVSFSPNGIDVLVNGRNIDIHYLSSGEKNDFVMFFQLIFMAEENGIVFIDEPEISLHIEWQLEYLERLIQICQMNGIQAIVATHSPSIVNGHLDLYAKRETSNEI